ncbi:MAG: NAD(P)H-hydrate dehydratase [Ilumatobacter sp.]|nr:NAD(P)H-hydrate dehydratase [Ilumatobacter sp.]
MIPIVTPAEMVAVDAAAPESLDVLIGRAAGAVARAAYGMLGGAYGRVVNVIAGPGNNGNDGRVAAELLRRRGIRVREFAASDCPHELPPADLVIDAAFGTGFHGTWTAPEIGDAAVLAVDIPTGVDALTGCADTGVLPADRTVTFQALKPGLLFGAGARLAGDVDVVDIGLDVSAADQHLVEASDVAGWWPARAVDAHKWRAAVRIVAGSPGMTGAAALCAAAAARAGAGLVKLSVPGTEAAVREEVVQQLVGETGWADDVLADISRFGALVVGPGIGRAEGTVADVRTVIADATVPVVVDGDALFATAWDADGAAPLFENRGVGTVLTPHDGEYSLLTGALPDADRIAATRTLARDLGCTVLLKGPATVVADADGSVLVVAHGDQRLATAGTGDVLAGMIGAALAAGAPAVRAAAAAAWLHADTARSGPAEGILAGDLIEALPMALAGIR